ncbi:hypothetical protein EMCRGX_G009522 [Ephydatia muelleri]
MHIWCLVKKVNVHCIVVVLLDYGVPRISLKMSLENTSRSPTCDKATHPTVSSVSMDEDMDIILLIECIIRVQHISGPKRLPLTIGMLEQLLQLLEADPLSRHDRVMLEAALTFGFFRFPRVSEYTLTNRGRFDHILHPTKSDITWVKDGVHFFIKKSKTDQVGRGTTTPTVHHAQLLHCKPTSNTASQVMFISFSKLDAHSHLEQ